MNKTRKGGGGGVREYDLTFLNVILHHVRDDSLFSRPNVGRYVSESMD